MKFWETKEFKNDERKWKLKLKQSGFKDIERSESSLNYYSYQVADRYSGAVEEYYRLARLWLNTAEFECDEYRIIWELHSEGFSSRKIEAELHRINSNLSQNNTYQNLTTHNHVKICEIIKILESKMLQEVS